MDKQHFEYINEDTPGYILADDKRVKILEAIEELRDFSPISDEIDFIWPARIQLFFEENEKISFRQYNVLVSFYDNFYKKHDSNHKLLESYMNSDEKVIKVRFA